MTNPNDGLPASIQARLLNLAKATGQEHNRLLGRYALERFLYRLSESRFREQFVLKGALMMLVWLGQEARPTRDADLLGYGDLTDDTIVKMFREVCGVEAKPDGMRYDVDTVEVADIRESDTYGGRRVTFVGFLGNARLHLQVDVGIGDAIALEPEWAQIPTLLDQPTARLRAYHPETSVAEKLQIIVAFGMANTRMKDFFDIAMLAQCHQFSGERLVAQVHATFKRRNTAVPTEVPDAFTDGFASDRSKQTQWTAFLARNRLPQQSLENVTSSISAFAMPIFDAVRDGKAIGTWPPGGPWQG
ncbi:MAG: nucleotidyl transferase AbiEii/AbiGii toxin family protein [Gammaproteobacteria bacterium]